MTIKKGFTLVELLITMAILGILATLAVPTYQKTIAQNRASEALVNLNIIHMGEKLYRLTNPGYYGDGTNKKITDINTALNLDMNSKYYGDNAGDVVITGDANGYVATIKCSTGCTKTFTNTYTEATNALDPTEGGSY